MHELSLAHRLISIATAALPQDNAPVTMVRLRIGDLAGVDVESLRFCFAFAAEGTRLAEATLEVEHVPVTVYCVHCDTVDALASIQIFRCPRCGQPTADLRSGRELELQSLELADVVATH